MDGLLCPRRCLFQHLFEMGSASVDDLQRDVDERYRQGNCMLCQVNGDDDLAKAIDWPREQIALEKLASSSMHRPERLWLCSKLASDQPQPQLVVVTEFQTSQEISD